jgi:DNA (cytosine-5)-methyltransferase 1
VAEAKRPAYLLLENVPGLLYHEKGETFRTILTAIHELGYSLEWCVLNSADFGVPQQRKRVYIVGYLDSRLSGKIFPLAKSNGASSKQLIPGQQGERVYGTDGASVCLKAQGGGWGAKTGLYFVDMNADPLVTLKARCITARQDAGVSNRRGEHSAVLITGAKVADQDSKLYLTAKDERGVSYSGRVRRLIPQECFRLQGFTDEQFEKVLWSGIPEAQLYKMAGNSVTTNVVAAVAKKLMEEIHKLEEENAESCI